MFDFAFTCLVFTVFFTDVNPKHFLVELKDDAKTGKKTSTDTSLKTSVQQNPKYCLLLIQIVAPQFYFIIFYFAEKQITALNGPHYNWVATA